MKSSRSHIRIHIKSFLGADNPKCDFTFLDTEKPQKIVHMMICARKKRLDAQKKQIEEEEKALSADVAKLFPDPGQGCWIPDHMV